MGRITTDQSHQIMSVLATNTDWGSIDFDALSLQDRIIRNPAEAGKQFAEFLKGNGQATPVAKTRKQKSSVLALCADVAIPGLTEAFVPREYFKTRAGLYLWNDMNRVLSGAKPVESTDGVTLKSFDLTRDAYDRDIKAELAESHEVELWHIAKLIDAQKNGEAGPLLTNGYANIFYVSGFAVSVNWIAGDRKWGVNDWRLVDGRWGRDYRVFSRN